MKTYADGYGEVTASLTRPFGVLALTPSRGIRPGDRQAAVFREAEETS